MYLYRFVHVADNWGKPLSEAVHAAGWDDCLLWGIIEETD